MRALWAVSDTLAIMCCSGVPRCKTGLDDGADDGAEDEDGNGGGAESGAAGKGPSATTAKQQRRDNKLVRVDARSQRLESFFIGGVMGPTPAGAAGGRGGGASASGRRSRADMEGGEEAGEFTDGDDTEEGAAAAGGGGGGASAAEALRRGAKLRRRGGTFGGGGANAAGGAGAGGSQEAQVVYDVNESELTSVRELNSEVVEACHQGLSGILKEHMCAPHCTCRHNPTASNPAETDSKAHCSRAYSHP